MRYPDYPFSSHFLEVNGQRLHYLDEGPRAAAPLLMLHGNPSWSFYYRKLVLALSAEYRCIVPDHIGMGLSAKPAAADYDFSLARRVDDLQSLLQQLGIQKRLTLILHDWGGMIGMAFADRQPESIARLVISNTAAFHLPAGKRIPWQLRLGRVPLLNRLLNQGLNAFCRGAVKYCVRRRPLPPAVARAYLAPYDSWHNRLAVRKFVEAIPLAAGDADYAVVDRVERGLQRFAQLPVLICWGLGDFVFDEDFLREWLRHFPDAELQRVEDAGHYLLEDAVEEIAPRVAAFLGAHPV